MFRIVWAFDPGRITGFASGAYSDTKPLELLSVDAILEQDMIKELKNLAHWSGAVDYIVSESFKDRGNNPFVTDDTPKRIEGMLDAVFGRVIYRPRSKKEQVPDRVLKDHGLWQTGKTVGWTDGRDVNDAIGHMLGFVAFDQKHKPTLQKYFRKATK